MSSSFPEERERTVTEVARNFSRIACRESCVFFLFVLSDSLAGLVSSLRSLNLRPEAKLREGGGFGPPHNSIKTFPTQ